MILRFTDYLFSFPDLKLIVRGGVGMDNIDVDYAKSVGKTVIIISHDDIDSAFRKISMKNGRVINSSFF